jgi:phosphomannomutase/phosphoglucomutase
VLAASPTNDFATLFRAYDIRGIFNKQLTEDVAKAIGVGFGRFVGKGGEVVIGRDVRLSGEPLRNGLIAGLLSGCNVTDIGIVSTPMLYFATSHLQKNAGIMITASHNPPEWNGFKMFKPNGCIYGEEMAKIKQLASTLNLERLRLKRGKTTLYEKVFQDYAEFVSHNVEVKRKLKIVADTANGVCGLFVPSLFEHQGCEILTLNQNPDGRFPAHLPEPKESTLGELMRKVVETNADFGVGYDGDGDRAVFVDDKGRLIPGDLALLIFAKEVLQRTKKAKVVCELSCSMAVEEYLKAHGGQPIIEKVGHTFIMDRMTSENAALGGEKSSHFYFAETNGGDDAIFAGLRMAEILSKSNKKLSALFDALPQYPSIFEENFACPDNLKFKVIEKLKSKFAFDGLRFLGVDGIKLLDIDGWVLLRPSNTEAIIRVNVEAKTEKKLKELHDFAVKELKQAMRE